MNQLDKLEAIEDIKKMKHRYYRYVDCKQYQQLADLFTENGTTAYDNGRLAFNGRQAIFEFFDKYLSDEKILTQHHGHHPEIEFTSDTTATGVWYMDDTVYVLAENSRTRGNGIYWDEYIKEEGEWKISHTGYERVWCTKEIMDANETRTWQSMFDEKETAKRAKRDHPAAKPSFCDKVS